MGTNIPVSDEVRDHIWDRKDRTESYDDWLRSVLELEDEPEVEQ